MTRLVTVAHGSRNPVGNQVPREITAAAAARLGVGATASYVELGDPLIADVMRQADEPCVVVPLLLSTGYHMRQDLPAAIAQARVDVAAGAPFGPDPALAAAQVARLTEAGAVAGQRVVLVAAGSSDEAATADQRAAVELLAAAWGNEVVLATLGGIGDRPIDVVRSGDAVSPYLLSPGYFADRVGDGLPADVVVADVIGVHPEVVGLVEHRYQTLVRRLVDRG